MKNVSNNFNAEFYVLSEYAMKNTCQTILMQNFMFFQNMQWKILHSI